LQNKKKFYISLVLFGLIGQVAWVVENMYLNVFIYQIFRASASDISLMVAASAVCATVTTVFIGALSDRIGRRKAIIVGGYLLWGISILGFALVTPSILGKLFPALTGAALSSLGVTLVILLDCLMTFFGSSANDAAFNAWLTDATEEGGRGAVEGINAMMPLVAILVVFGGFMSFDLALEGSWKTIFLIIGIAVLLTAAIGFFCIKDAPQSAGTDGERYFAQIAYGFRPSVIKKNPALYLILIAFAIFGISIQIFMPYLILYYSVSLAMENYVLIMAPAILLASVFTFFYGRVYDRIGFSKSVYISLALLLSGYAILFLFKNAALVFIGSLLMMCGYLAGMAVFGAAIRDRTPVGMAGRFQGLRIVSQVLIPGVIGPWIGAAVLKNAELVTNNDGTTSFLPNENIFLAAAVAGIIIPILIYFFQKLLQKREKEI
jgi:MFS family permease